MAWCLARMGTSCLQSLDRLRSSELQAVVAFVMRDCSHPGISVGPLDGPGFTWLHSKAIRIYFRKVEFSARRVLGSFISPSKCLYALFFSRLSVFCLQFRRAQYDTGSMIFLPLPPISWAHLYQLICMYDYFPSSIFSHVD